MAESAKEAIYLKNVFSELNMGINVQLFNDNQSAKLLSENNVFHAKSKHIDLKYHFIRDAIKNKSLNLKYLPTEKMVADILTKPLGKAKHAFCCKELGLRKLNKI